MASEAEEETQDSSLLEEFKHKSRSILNFTVKYYLTVFAIALGGSSQFYSYGVVNPTQKVITQWINESYYDRGITIDPTTMGLMCSFLVSSITVGAIVGALLTRTIGERCGRRKGLIVNGVINMVGAALELIARPCSSPEMLLAGRFILGINIGLTSGLCPMYLMEITPERSRGVAGTIHQVAVSFADWFSLLIALPDVLGSAERWPWAFAFPGAFALTLIIILPFSPDSPKWLLNRKKDHVGARAACAALVGDDLAPYMFEELMQEYKLEQDESPATYRELFGTPELRKLLGVAAVVMLAQQSTGCAAVFAYSTDMFEGAKVDGRAAQYATLGIGVTYFISTCFAPALIERVGRRPLLLFQLSACFVALCILTAFTAAQTYFEVAWASWGTIGALVLYMCVYGVGSPIPWMITGELFSQRFRSSAATIITTFAWLLAFGTSTAYLPFSQLVGVTFSYLPFLAGLVAVIIAIKYILPETRHVSLKSVKSTQRDSSSIGYSSEH